MGKVIGGILGTLAIVVLVLFLLLHFGLLSWGNNSGNGEGDKKSEETEIEDSSTADEIEEIIVTIVVTQDKYFIDEQEVTLTQINEKVTDKSAIIKVVLENNYASAKAWDDIKTNLTEWGIIPIEQ